MAKAEGAEERICIHEKLDYTKSAVWRLDFSKFDAPGEYRVLVPGVGSSGPFRIAADVWEAPFKAAMQGILTQRQGIELGPPACRYTRRRPFHPEDGVVFYQLDIPCQAGQEGTRGKHMIELTQSGPLQRVTGVWGSYQDAGDWDTIGHHLSATYDLLGLYDLNPARFARMKLSLPAEEMRNDLPDIIAGTRTDFPLIFACRYFSTPAQGGLALIYAYELTKKPAYLAAAVQGANYSLGANPDNLSYCTGIGYNPQHFNFIVDAQVTGQLPDVLVGHIPYGQGNEGNAMSRGSNGWVQQRRGRVSAARPCSMS